MAYHLLHINFIGAKELKNVRHLGNKMRVYAVVSIPGSCNNEQLKTAVDNEGDQNPNWNDCDMKFTIATAAAANRPTLIFKLYCESTLGDRELSEFSVPLMEFLSGEQVVQFRERKVRTPSGEQLNFTYKVTNTDELPSDDRHPPVQAQNSGGTSWIKKVIAPVVAMGTTLASPVVGFLSEEVSSVIHNPISSDQLDSETLGSNYRISGRDNNYGTPRPGFNYGTSRPGYNNRT